MLERELKAPGESPKNAARSRGQNAETSHSRTIPVAVKRSVYRGECNNCGVRHGLEYDHIQKFSHGGKHDGGQSPNALPLVQPKKGDRRSAIGFFCLTGLL